VRLGIFPFLTLMMTSRPLSTGELGLNFDLDICEASNLILKVGDAEDPENGCEPLGKQGTRGTLFRLTLEWYGYTFVAKGTVTAFEAKLKHEGLVYQHLDEVQGELVPVYLGNISLVRPYFLDIGVRIVHMLFMSWEGEQARKDLMLAMGRDLAVETGRAG